MSKNFWSSGGDELCAQNHHGDCGWKMFVIDRLSISVLISNSKWDIPAASIDCASLMFCPENILFIFHHPSISDVYICYITASQLR